MINWSAISNAATAYNLDTTAPSANTNPNAATSLSAVSLDLSLVAPGDDGVNHTINGGTFRIYYSTVAGNLAGLTSTTSPTSTLNRVDLATSSVNPGTTQYYTLGGLLTD